MPDDLSEAIESPLEDERHEYKRWLDLKDSRARRETAKHVAALANYGGGYLIFGFNDDLTPDTSALAEVKTLYNHDYFNMSLIPEFMDPPVHCDVLMLKSASTGHEHCLVRVPGHGATPICFKKSGEALEGSVEKWEYYTRKPGPRSEKIVSGAEWKTVIQRCVFHEREHFVALAKEMAASLQVLQEMDQSQKGVNPAPDTQEKQAEEKSHLAKLRFFKGLEE